MSVISQMHRNDLRELVRKHGRIRPKERGMPTDIVFEWSGLIELIEACIELEKAAKKKPDNAKITSGR